MDVPNPPVPVVAPGERYWTRSDTRRMALAVGTVVLGGLVARDGVPELEKDVFELINGLPDGLYRVVWLPMQLGSLVGGLAAAVALGVATRRRAVTVISMGAVVAAWMAAKVVKGFVERGRPLEVGLEAVVRDSSAGLGYVSGHTAVAFAMYSMAVPHLNPRVRPIVLAAAVLVGLSRIYAGAHLPLDVVGGAALGVIVGEGFRRLESAHKDWVLRRRLARSSS